MQEIPRGGGRSGGSATEPALLAGWPTRAAARQWPAARPRAGAAPGTARLPLWGTLARWREARPAGRRKRETGCKPDLVPRRDWRGGGRCRERPGVAPIGPATGENDGGGRDPGAALIAQLTAAVAHSSPLLDARPPPTAGVSRPRQPSSKGVGVVARTGAERMETGVKAGPRAHIGQKVKWGRAALDAVVGVASPRVPSPPAAWLASPPAALLAKAGLTATHCSCLRCFVDTALPAKAAVCSLTVLTAAGPNADSGGTQRFW